MTSIRPFTMNDLFYFNNVNLDVLTETYNLQFYMQYMTYWPESFVVAKTSTTTTADTHYNRRNSSDDNKMNSYVGRNEGVSMDHHSTGCTAVAHKNYQHTDTIMGYLLGKAEGEGRLWHGHVSAITISKYYRRISMAKSLMHQFENTISTDQKQNFFVDLFVRKSNTLAIEMYHNFGYRVYRTVLGYYQSTTGAGTSKHKTTSEDAYDMRKSLPRDPQQLAMIPLPHPVRPEDLEW